MNPNKIIFLDVDGVLNSQDQIVAQEGKRSFLFGTFDFHVEKLARIVKETDAKIVMSSTWRSFFDKDEEKGSHFYIHITERFRKFGIELSDRTPFYGFDGKRGLEIKDWLSRHPEVEKFVILDDEAFDIRDYYKKEFVKTNFMSGLLDEHVEKAIKILNKR